MNRGGRPAAVLQFLHRPLWWAAGVAVFASLLFASDLRLTRWQDEVFGDSLAVTATRAESPPTAPEVFEVVYPDPRTGAPVRATLDVQNTALLPPVGAEIPIEVSRTDPRLVQLVGDRHNLTEEVPYYLFGVGLALAFWLSRVLHVRRTERLMAAPVTSFAMLAAVVPPLGLHRRWRLFLYPVDAVPGSDPVCLVTLVTLPTLPSGVFPVEVKGSPRAFGRVAVRADHTALWPRGRALTRARWPRPATIGTFAPPLPVPRPEPVGPRPSLVVPRVLRCAGLVLLGVYLWGSANLAFDEHQVLGRSRTVTALVATAGTPSEGAIAVTLRYETEAGTRQALLRLPASQAAVGATVVIRYDPEHPDAVWTLLDTHPPTGDAGWWFFALLGLPVLLVSAAVSQGEERRRLAAFALLRDGVLDDGFPPVGQQGFVVADGRLGYDPGMDRPTLATWGRRRTIRFEPDGIVVVARDGTSDLLAWPTLADLGKVDLPLSNRRGIAERVIELLVSRPDTHRGLGDPGRAHAALLYLVIGQRRRGGTCSAGTEDRIVTVLSGWDVND